MRWDEWDELWVINVDSYHTQKGVYTTNQIPTRTERNAWHHGNVMKMKIEMKLMVKPIKTLTQAPYEKSLVAYDFHGTTYQALTIPTLTQTIKLMNIIERGADELNTGAFQ